MLCSWRVASLGLFIASSSTRSALVRGFTLAVPTTTSVARATASSTVLAMADTLTDTIAEVKVGDAIPSVILSELTDPDGKPESVNLAELCAGKKVAIFGVPGAFTPGCSKSHLPSFMNAQADLKAKGIDMTICVATNDAFVMEAWGRTSGGAAAGIRFLSDGGSGALTKALGLVVATPMGMRTKRFSLIADNNVVTHYFSSAKESSDTWAPAVLSAL
jgi:peroxiredoxin